MSNKEKVINIIMGMTDKQIDDFCKYVKRRYGSNAYHHAQRD